uniref:Gamma-butyrobetaine hydroxylase-like N-terminal domain-containing protein n=1 Tax=Photinus pyralis TaxID=7054 RepID=A0A1Y1LG79_PHOPY
MYRTSLATKLKLFSRFVRKFSFVCVSENQENLIVDVGKGKEVFPLVWLRDNCRCPSCFHKSSTSRIINWVDFNVSPKATSVQVSVNLFFWVDCTDLSFQRKSPICRLHCIRKSQNLRNGANSKI